MNIDNMITLLIQLKYKHGGGLKLYIDKSSMREYIYNDFRNPSIFIDVYDSENKFKDTFELGIGE